MRHKDPHPPVERLVLTDVMAALSDPLRIGVVRLLADERERTFGEFDAPVAKSTLSHHLRTLRAAGVTRTREEGTRCYVRLRRADLEARFPGLLDAVLAAAGRDAVGDRIRLQAEG
ncbi:DNA-binding transcriptional ArsR family regulator [Saccharothrix tamanrassetensis]|uniref:DNA-binding transcriptional ArsR family regulator n=1 Tax=Saccharothrix tamanrassetensis TaxID=1051531 RepID=A0A841CD58_9PSEU|nr:helix-turn-helix domain-containing protein [Saccharothrix tamanrassetensis]MBB5953686.1 DNA-binding transcriptional ArsR family regulator [Saccharothrix tamanrassetensis]